MHGRITYVTVVRALVPNLYGIALQGVSRTTAADTRGNTYPSAYAESVRSRTVRVRRSREALKHRGGGVALTSYRGRGAG